MKPELFTHENEAFREAQKNEMQLREYQINTIEKLRNSIRNGNRRLILQASCGAGKTIMAAEIVSRALGKNKKIIFLVHFRQLAYQAMERFQDYGIGDEVSFIMAGEKTDHEKPVQIISVQTYGRRLQLDSLESNQWFKDADLVIYDECHASIAKTRKEIIDLYKDDAVILGLSASPCRADGRGLGEIYQDIVPCIGIKELTQQGYLVPARYFGAQELPDLEKIPTVAGDYNQKELGKRVNKKRLIGDILLNWTRIAGDRSTVIFATNVKHSLHIKEQFQRNDISIEHVDAHTPQEERDDIIRRWKDGDVQVVTNVGVFSEGADFPWCDCCVAARPTKSYARFIQIAGRPARPYPGKKDFIFIDHANLIPMHGFIEDPVTWSLDGRKIAWSKPKNQPKEKLPNPVKCRVCSQIFIDRKSCPVCNTELVRFGRKIEHTDHELKELKKKNRDYSWDEKVSVMQALVWHAEKKGYKPGWSAFAYKDFFGVMPNDPRVKYAEPVKPEGKAKNILKHILIRKSYAYRKRMNQNA